MTQQLTERQTQIMKFICSRIAHDGMTPTLAEIGQQFGIKNPNGVKTHLAALEKKGALLRNRVMFCTSH